MLYAIQTIVLRVTLQRIQLSIIRFRMHSGVLSTVQTKKNLSVGLPVTVCTHASSVGVVVEQRKAVEYISSILDHTVA